MWGWISSFWKSKSAQIEGPFLKFDGISVHKIYTRAAAKIDPSTSINPGEHYITVSDTLNADSFMHEFLLEEKLKLTFAKQDDKVAFVWEAKEKAKLVMYVLVVDELENTYDLAEKFKSLASECLFENIKGRRAEASEAGLVQGMLHEVKLEFSLHDYKMTSTEPSAPVLQPLLSTVVTPAKPAPITVSSTPVSKPAATTTTTTTTTTMIQQPAKQQQYPQTPVKPAFTEDMYPRVPASLIDNDEDEFEDLFETEADLYIFNNSSNLYEISRSKMKVTIRRIGPIKKYFTVLRCSQADAILEQIIDDEMQMQFHPGMNSITWLYPEGKQPIFMSLVLTEPEEQSDFFNMLNDCILEASMQTQSSKISELDKSVQLASRMDNLKITEDDPYDTQGKDKFSDEELLVPAPCEYDIDDDDMDYKMNSPKKNPPPKTSGEKNKLLADSYRHGRTFVVKGNSLNVFKKTDDGIAFTTKVDLKDVNKKFFSPRRSMLHEQDTSLVMVHPDQSSNSKGELLIYDIEKQSVVEQFKPKAGLVGIEDVAPVAKYAQQSNEELFAALSNSSFFTVDPRAQDAIGGWTGLTKNPHFSCIATDSTGNIAVGAEDGSIRMYNGIPGQINLKTKKEYAKIAKTHLDGFGTAIKGIDVTGDGKWIVATCKHYLIVIPTECPKGLGFEVRMGDYKPKPRRLQLINEDIAKIGAKNINFTPARFNTGCDGELWITTSTGPYIITWNFKKIQQNVTDCYIIKKQHDNVVMDQFAAVPQNQPGRNAPLVIAMEHDVKLEKRHKASSNPYRKSSTSYKK